MTAFEAMSEILDINETVERLKDSNTGTQPDLNICQEVDLLVKYRELLVELLGKIEISEVERNF